MHVIRGAERPPRKSIARDLTAATHGIGWAATAVMVAATVVIAIVAPI